MTIYLCLQGFNGDPTVVTLADEDELISHVYDVCDRNNGGDLWDKKTGHELLAAYGYDNVQDVDYPGLVPIPPLPEHGLESTYYYSHAMDAWTTEAITQLDACIDYLEEQARELRIYWSTEEAKAAIRDRSEWGGHNGYELMAYLSDVIWDDENTVRYQLFRDDKGAEYLVIHYYDSDVDLSSVWISSDLAGQPEKIASIMRQIDTDPAGVRSELICLDDGYLIIDSDYGWIQDRDYSVRYMDIFFSSLLIADQDGVYEEKKS